VRIAGNQAHPGQAASDQVTEEGQPAGAVLRGGDLQAQDFPVPVGVDAGRDQGVDQDHAAVLTDLHRQGVRGEERVRALVQRPGPERLDLRVEIGCHPRDLRLAQPRDAEGLDQLLHPPRRNAEQVARGHHARQGRFGAAAALQQPVREVRP
jgi:hypothetical protein